MENVPPPPQAQGHQTYTATGAQARTLTALMSLASEVQIVVSDVAHVNKDGQRTTDDGRLPQIGDVKGISNAAQAASFLLAYGGDRNTSRRTLALRGRRRTQTLGPDGRLDFDGNELTLQFYPLATSSTK